MATRTGGKLDRIKTAGLWLRAQIRRQLLEILRIAIAHIVGSLVLRVLLDGSAT